MGRSVILQLLVVVTVLVAIDLIARAAGWDFRVSIIGSVLLTLAVSGILALVRRSST